MMTSVPKSVFIKVLSYESLFFPFLTKKKQEGSWLRSRITPINEFGINSFKLFRNKVSNRLAQMVFLQQKIFLLLQKKTLYLSKSTVYYIAFLIKKFHSSDISFIGKFNTISLVSKPMAKLKTTPTYNSTCFYLFILMLSSMQGQMFLGDNVYVDNFAGIHIEKPGMVFGGGKLVANREGVYGIVSFGDDTSWEGADHNSYVDGFVRTLDSEAFNFPTGHGGVFQPIRIKRTTSNSGPIDMSYSYKAHEHLDPEEGIELISNRFYWTVVARDSAYVSLSWNAFGNVDDLILQDLSNISIAGYDGNLWRLIDSEVDEEDFIYGSPSTDLSGSITSKVPVKLDDYSAFSIVSIPKDISLGVSQGFTPNGDGINDTWKINNIEYYPNAKIRVYSKWEREVFIAENGYQNDWNGVYKNKKEPLPDGSYFYVIDTDGDGLMDLTGWVYITR
jgi:gliding motility-associated-like protein